MSIISYNSDYTVHDGRGGGDKHEEDTCTDTLLHATLAKKCQARHQQPLTGM